jgi:poly-gamma-glutamate capsule biosynthesis protein CapA/YwtB (metallophosphatase superfamily)
MGESPLRLFLAGDVMTGRGIDQILQHPGDPVLYEASVRDAAVYVDFAEQVNGPIPRAVAPRYIWGDALSILDEEEPDMRLINLETSVTAGGSPWPGKGIHYRMNPANIECLSVAGIDCCTVANNHVLDWSFSGLHDTLQALGDRGIATTGAGEDAEGAWKPAIMELGDRRRVVIVGLATPSSGVPRGWEALSDRPGVAKVDGLSHLDVDRVAEVVSRVTAPGDLVIASIHWGPNWGYGRPDAHQRFAHRLIDEAGVHLVHGHSSHHALGIEVYRGRLVLYGCGDLINDYEGIGSHDEHRPELSVLYIVSLAGDGRLDRLDLFPLRMRRMRLERAAEEDAIWMADTLTRESERWGVTVAKVETGRLEVRVRGA